MDQGMRMNTGIENFIEYFIIRSSESTMNKWKRSGGHGSTETGFRGGLRRSIDIVADMVGSVLIKSGGIERWSRPRRI
jgi:hypothetical protein